jgi:hypothetical protein
MSHWFYSPSCNRVLKQNQDKSWSSHSAHMGRRGRKQFYDEPTEPAFVSILLTHGNLYPADVTLQQGSITLSGYDDRRCTEPGIAFPTKPKQKTMDDLGCVADKWFTKHTSHEIDELELAIKNGQCKAVSDGSAYEGEESSAAWCMGKTGTEEIISAGMQVHGPNNSHCSYRSEMAGIYGILLALWSICKDRNIRKGAIEIGTDSESVLKRLFQQTAPAHLGDHSWDLLSACQKLIKQLSFIDITTRHIPSHQDDKNKMHKKGVDLWTDRNIEMDLRAEEMYRIVAKEDTAVFKKSGIWNIRVNGQPVVCNFRDSVRKATVGRGILDYWKKKEKIGNNQDIGWESFASAMQELPNKKRRWIVKQTSGRCAVGVEMKRRRQWPHSKCPRCDEPNETSTHVLQCTGSGADGIWQKAIEELRLWLAHQRTNNALADTICASLTSWRDGNIIHNPQSNLLDLRKALEAQNDIGWDAALEGRWSMLWIDIQQRHFTQIKKRRSGKRWLTAIIKRMWDISWDLWQHRNDEQVLRNNEERKKKNAVNIRYEYGLGPIGLDQHDKKLFEATLAETLTAKLQTQDAWIRRVTLARKRCEHTALHQVQRNYLNFYNLLHSLRRRERSNATPAEPLRPEQQRQPRQVRRIHRTTN